MDEKKQIEEMVHDMCIFYDNGKCGNEFICEKPCATWNKAERLHNAGYRNCKDKVVLTREEYETLKNESAEIAKDYQEMARFYDEKCEELEQARNETAREIIVEMFSYMGSQQQFCIVDDGNKTLIDCDNLFDFVGKLAKQYEVEVE